MTIIEKLTEFVKDEEGLTMVEYAIAGALVAGGAVLAFTQLGGTVANSINQLEGAAQWPGGGGATP